MLRAHTETNYFGSWKVYTRWLSYSNIRLNLKWWNTFRFEIEDFAFQQKCFELRARTLYLHSTLALAILSVSLASISLYFAMCPLLLLIQLFLATVSHSKYHSIFFSSFLSQNMMQMHVVTSFMLVHSYRIFAKYLLRKTVSFIYHSLYHVFVAAADAATFLFLFVPKEKESVCENELVNREFDVNALENRYSTKFSMLVYLDETLFFAFWSTNIDTFSYQPEPFLYFIYVSRVNMNVCACAHW